MFATCSTEAKLSLQVKQNMPTQEDGDELSLRVPIKANMVYPDIETILYDTKEGDKMLYTASDKVRFEDTILILINAPALTNAPCLFSKN